MLPGSRRRPGTGAVAPGRHGTYGEGREPVLPLRRCCGGEMGREHALDLRSARASLDPVDNALALDEDERRHLLDEETLG